MLSWGCAADGAPVVLPGSRRLARRLCLLLLRSDGGLR